MTNSTATPTDLISYIVTVDTPQGVLDVELSTHLGPDAAARRAKASLFMSIKRGTPDDYVVIGTIEGMFPEPR